MFYGLTALSGILTSLMIACNGGLSDRYGAYTANAIIHITGLILITSILVIKREKIYFKKLPPALYAGGAIGVATTIFNNLAFGRISVSAILALSLLGQSVTSILVDELGLLQMAKHPANKGKIIGLALTASGILCMITDFDPLAITLSFLSGINLVVSRTLNARLAGETSANLSTFFNYLIGLSFALPLMLLSRLMGGAADIAPVALNQVYIYFGGILGVAVVFISNLVVTKISAFHMTLLLFVSQIFTGIILDIIITNVFSLSSLIGGVIVALGLIVNLWLDNRKKAHA